MSREPRRAFDLSPGKRALLDALLKQQGLEASGAQRIPRRREQGPAPLSFAQQRLWLLDRIQPETAVYNIPLALRLVGPLDLGLVAQALNEIVRRHEILRTTLHATEGEPVQVVAPLFELQLPVHDLGQLGGEEREAEALHLADQEVHRPFDLAKGPLLRAQVLRLRTDEHVLVITMHHIISEGWALDLLLKELGIFYQAFAAGEPSPLRELPIQYADYAVWQRQWLQGDALEQQLSHWKSRLSGLTVLELPLDHPRPPIQSFSGATQSRRLPRSLVDSLITLGQKEGATPFMGFLAAFKALLHRYTGQQDIVLGSPITNRNRTELEELIGFFVNTLVLRADLSGDPTFRQLLARVRDGALDAYSHQDLPFEKLVEELRPARDTSHTPLVQAMFVLQNTPSLALSLPGVTVTPLALPRRTAKFDLTLEISDSPHWTATLEYNTDLFRSDTASRMLVHLENLLKGAVADPDRPISALTLISDAESRLLLTEWNATRRDLPSLECVPARFDERAARAPAAPALVCGRDRITYGELSRRANRLANALRRRGAHAGVLVAVLAERSVEMVVGLLAVLKTGAAYVPLDPAYPKDRLGFMLADTAAPLLLTQERLLERLPRSDAEVLCLDRDADSWGAESADAPPGRSSPDDLAYVIYTSGSTGQPKGVEIGHLGLNNLIAWHQRAYAVTPDDRATQLAGPAFDASVWELWPYLTAGAAIHIPDDETRASAPRLIRWLASERITLSFLPTPLAEAVLDEPVPEGFALRALLTGGDRLHRAPRHALPFRLVNHYGPTENTVVSTCAEVPVEADGSGPPPIGRPIDNTEAFLLDSRLQPVPIGVPGELYVGGVGLARGYLNHAELTAEKFIRNPFDATGASRLYRTGDLCRRRPDGNLEFLGRSDDQVKLRGYRIEPGEIEKALGGHPGVQAAVVLARERPDGDRQLVSYVVFQPGPQPTIDQLKDRLRQVLPEYMVPALFVTLEQLPLTPNGKIDRRALPQVEDPSAGRALVEPRTPTESLLREIWRKVLRLDAIGVQDNFFDVGGHSLLATQMQSRVRETFQVELPLRTVFEAPTLAGMAQAIEKARGQEALGAPPVERALRDQPLRPSFGQERLWFLEQLDENSVYTIPGAFRLQGALHTAALRASLQEIVRRHESLRTRFTVVEGVPIQEVSAPGPFHLDEIDLGALPAAEQEAEVRRLARREGDRILDLARDPLLQCRLLRLGPQHHVLLVTTHHIVSDGWSFGVLMTELAALYAAFSEGRPSPLPDLPLQYADFAQWQRSWLQGEVLGPQLGYWKRQLASLPVLSLPTDRPRPAVQSYRGAREEFRLPGPVSEGLKALSRSEGVTPFMTLLAAFQALLARYTGQEDIVLGSPIAGRNRPEIEGLIGLFANTLVLRTDLSGDPSFRDLLKRVREVALDAYAHQDVPFEKLVEELRPQRDLGRNPLFQVMFALQNASPAQWELQQLSLSPLSIERTASQFDLSLYMSETPEGFAGNIEYCTDLFDSTSVAGMLGHFATLLGGVVDHPDWALSRLPLLDEVGRRRLLVDWNATAADYDRETCLPVLFSAQAARTPDAVAAELGGAEMSYRELDRRSNQLAHHLARLGAGPEVLVALCVERSLDMLVGLLGVLKAGAAYVPLDPAYPAERLAFMLEDSCAAILVTQERLTAALSGHRAKVVRLDADWGEIAREPSDPARARPRPDDLAYVIYTSGSTGKPKGVQIAHRALVNFLVSMQERPGLTAHDALLSVTTLSFDIAGLELYLPLIVGARIVLVGRDAAADGRLLIETLEARGVTVMQATPATWRLLLDAGWRGSRGLRILCGGEALPRDLAEQLLDRAAALWNMYGPTETTIWSALAEVRRGDGQVPIGRPIANTQIYALDRHLQPVPSGAPGELYIGGEGLARGYLNRPELTAERFVPDPFGTQPAGRLYRTGDLGRHLSDGTIECLGRIDHQVKVRGFRIELGEVEAGLRRHPEVREVVVMAREDSAGDKRLAAYVVAANGTAPHDTSLAAGLRDFLHETLPDYMLPSAFVFLEALPRTPNGKVDRRSLPRPEPVAADACVPPRTRAEKILAEIWQEVLGASRVGIYDNFFDLGGHSLLSMRVVYQVERRLGKRLNPAELVLQTLGQIAALCERPALVEAPPGVGTGLWGTLKRLVHRPASPE